MIEQRPIAPIRSLAALYDFVNHYWTNGRVGDREGRFHIYGTEGVKLTVDQRQHVVVTDANLDQVEIWQDGTYVDLLAFDAERYAAAVDRLEARQLFERSVQATRVTAKHLRESVDALHPDDRELMLQKAGQLDVSFLGEGEIEWPAP